MRRFTFYILVALLTFGIGYFIALKFYWKTAEKIIITEKRKEIKVNNQSKIEPLQSFTMKETEQLSSEFTQEKRVLEKRFCNDKRILPVWEELKKDENFRERGGYGESGNCSDMLELKAVDLNQ